MSSILSSRGRAFFGSDESSMCYMSVRPSVSLSVFIFLAQIFKSFVISDYGQGKDTFGAIILSEAAARDKELYLPHSSLMMAHDDMYFSNVQPNSVAVWSDGW